MSIYYLVYIYIYIKETSELVIRHIYIYINVDTVIDSSKNTKLSYSVPLYALL